MARASAFQAEDGVSITLTRSMENTIKIWLEVEWEHGGLARFVYDWYESDEEPFEEGEWDIGPEEKYYNCPGGGVLEMAWQNDDTQGIMFCGYDSLTGKWHRVTRVKVCLYQE